MKSVIMALFLMSVSLGNIFTAGVNYFILVPSHAIVAKDVASLIAKPAKDGEVIDPEQFAASEGLHYEALSGGGFALDLAGLDGVLGGDDDIRLGFGPDGVMTGFINTEVEGMHEGIAAIGRYWVEHDRLPDPQTGSEIIGAVHDGWGRPLHYEVRTRKAFIVSSEGPDAIWQSQFDIRAEVDVTSQTRAESAAAQTGASESDLLSWAHPAQTWLETRRAELDAAASESNVASDGAQPVDEHAVEGFDRSIRWDVGGATTLAGDDYFWFFTWIMLGTAVLFLPVAYLYKPHTYLQEEADG
jgi:POT family proton-dependent oligopeptide transporter